MEFTFVCAPNGDISASGRDKIGQFSMSGTNCISLYLSRGANARLPRAEF